MELTAELKSNGPALTPTSPMSNPDSHVAEEVYCDGSPTEVHIPWPPSSNAEDLSVGRLMGATW